MPRKGDLPQIASFKLNEVQSHLIITNHLVQTGGHADQQGLPRKRSPGRPGSDPEGRQGGRRLGQR